MAKLELALLDHEIRAQVVELSGLVLILDLSG